MMEEGEIAEAASTPWTGRSPRPRCILVANRMLAEKRLKNNGTLIITSYTREGET